MKIYCKRSDTEFRITGGIKSKNYFDEYGNDVKSISAGDEIIITPVFVGEEEIHLTVLHVTDDGWIIQATGYGAAITEGGSNCSNELLESTLSKSKIYSYTPNGDKLTNQ